MIIKAAAKNGNKAADTVFPFAIESRLQKPAHIHYNSWIIA